MLFIFVSLCALSFILRSFQRRHNYSVMPDLIVVMPDLIGHLPVILSEAKDLFTLPVIPSAASVSHP